EQPADHLWRRSRAAPRRGERDHLPSAPRPYGREQRRRPVTVTEIRDRQPQPRVAPALREVALDRLPLVDDAHEAEHKLNADGEGRTEKHAQRGARADVPSRDAPDQALRGEGRG